MDETLPTPAPEETTAPVTCPICSKQVQPTVKFCDGCGYPIGGTEFDQNEFQYAYDLKKHDLDTAKDVVKSGTTTLFVLAGLIAVGNTVLYFTTDQIEILIAGVFIVAIFLGLAFWSKKKPFTALVVALIVYVTIILADAFFDPYTILKGLLLKIIIIGALIKAIRGAKDAQNIMEEMEARNWNR